MAEEKVSALDRLKKAKEKVAGLGTRPKPKAYSLADDESAPPKVMLYGPSGSGKTFFIIGLLLAGEVVFVVSSDFGSNGLATVKNELKRRGRLELLKNIRGIDLDSYDDIEGFFSGPTEYVEDFYTLGITVVVWEGFSTFQTDILDEYILSHAPGAEKSGELRYAGFTHTVQDWQGMKRGSVRAVRKFLGFRMADGKQIAKVLTALEEATGGYNDLSGKTEKGPLVQGAAKKLMAPGFDVIMNVFQQEDKGAVTYHYRCAGDTSKHLVKSRGYDLKPVEEANPERVWKIIRAAGGGKSEVVDDNKAA